MKMFFPVSLNLVYITKTDFTAQYRKHSQFLRRLVLVSCWHCCGCADVNVIVMIYFLN